MNSLSTTGQAIINYFTPVEQVRKAHAFFEAWKNVVKQVQPELFLINEASLVDSICTKDLTPNIEVIKESISSLSTRQQHLICVLMSLYDAEEGQRLSQQIGFEFFRDFINFEDSQKELVAKLIKNFSSSQEYWGDFIN